MDRGATIWFTGLSGSGKTTIANSLAERLRAAGRNVEILDGDVIRRNLSKGLGFTKEGRDENIKRVGFVCHLLSRNGVFAMAAVISPYAEARNANRALIGDFVEVYCKCPIEVLTDRDVKGLYKRALAGEIKGFTGVDDPYEAPENPEVVCETDKESPEQSVQKIWDTLVALGYLAK
ncbi:MAG: adenylyl-sulfate kinase [bacterium]